MRYLFYFFYIAWNWGISLAVFIIWHEIRGEKRYGIRTIGIDNLSGDVSPEDRRHASIYEPVNYYSATWLFNHLDKTDTIAAFLDAGCGKGRVLAIAATYGFTNIRGIDISRKLCTYANSLATSITNKYPDASVTVACADARNYDIPDSVGVIFLFNPFNHIVMKDFIRKVCESLDRNKRPVKVLYANPQYKELWIEAGFMEEVSFKKAIYLKGCILKINS